MKQNSPAIYALLVVVAVGIVAMFVFGVLDQTREVSDVATINQANVERSK